MSALLTRSLAIVGVIFVVGTAHSMLRQTPIKLNREPAPVLPGDGTAEPPADTGDQQPTRSGEPGDADPVDPLDAPVKPGAITLRQASVLHESGAVFFDARRIDEFEAGHIAGAIWMPADRVGTDESMLDLAPLFEDPTTPVVMYCEGGECDASENATIRLESLGLGLTIHILGLGYEDWAGAGLPTEGGP